MPILSAPKVPTREDVKVPSSEDKKSKAEAPIISAEDREHREGFREYAVAQSEENWRPTMRRLYALWDEYVELLGVDMVPPYILLAPPTFSHAIGQYWPTSSFGGHSEIRIRRTLLTGEHPMVTDAPQFAEGRFRVVADVLLHEFVHQYNQEVLNQPEDVYSGHGPKFRDVCNQIGAKLGLPRVREGKARGKDKDLPTSKCWPHCVRPDDYYLGALVSSAMDVAPATKLTISLASAEKAAGAIIKATDADFARELAKALLEAAA
jgi:hypothetical protein